MDREERLRRRREQYHDGTELQKLQKRESRGWKEGEHVRCRRAMMSTEQRQMLLQWRREARHRTESIAENQPLEIPSFCTRDRDLPIPINTN